MTGRVEDEEGLVKASGDRVSYCPVLAQWKRPEEWLDSLQ